MVLYYSLLLHYVHSSKYNPSTVTIQPELSPDSSMIAAILKYGYHRALPIGVERSLSCRSQTVMQEGSYRFLCRMFEIVIVIQHLHLSVMKSCVAYLLSSKQRVKHRRGEGKREHHISSNDFCLRNARNLFICIRDLLLDKGVDLLQKLQLCIFLRGICADMTDLQANLSK